MVERKNPKPELTKDQADLASILCETREKFGLTLYGAAKASGVHHSTLGALEGRWGTAQAPERITLFTICSVVKLYWPHIELRHFSPQTELAFSARDPQAARRLRSRAERLMGGARPHRRASFV